MSLEIDIDRPRYDQNTYWGRARHFLATTNPLNVFASEAELQRAKNIVQKLRKKEPLDEPLSEDEIWRCKHLYDSAFHPDSGEKMMLIGRMSAQVPCNMVIVGGIISFYKSTGAVVFWQWLNQSFNALVNYTNRGGDSQLTEKQMLVSYLSATTGAVATAVGLNKLVKRMPPLVGRCVPFVAVAAANCINIPLMRYQELQAGTPVFDSNNEKLGYSKNAAQSGIAQVVFSRIAMATPAMVLTPAVVDQLEKRGVLRRYPWISLPLQVLLVGLCFTFATPLTCALFKQNAEIKVDNLEPDIQEEVKSRYKDNPPAYVYFNKGL